MKTFGFFYYSPKMRKMQHDMGRFTHNFARQALTGKVVEYNEWASRFPFLPMNKWGDNKLVAIGWYDHSKKDEGVMLQGKDAKEFIKELRGY